MGKLAFHGERGQTHGELGALSDAGADCVERSMVELDYGLGERQSYTQPATASVQRVLALHEHRKYGIAQARINAAAIVAHRNTYELMLFTLREGHLHVDVSPCVRIAGSVVE
jgi:hypothetical protein